MKLDTLCAAAVIVVIAWLLRNTFAEMCKEEMRTRLNLLPCALIRLAIWRLPQQARSDASEEWHAELAYVLKDADGLPLTRLIRGIRYAAGLLLSARSIGRELAIDGPEAGYRGPTACMAAGITYRQLDYWARNGLVSPSVGANSGERLYSFRDILILKVVKRLLDAGISVQQVKAAALHLGARGANDLRVATLMSDGESVYECTSPDEVVDRLTTGQGVFGIGLSRIWGEVTEALTGLPGGPPRR